ncbi:conserved hypothetical protein [Ktedonobacter racemifer DSM 44963]|uniref:Transposase n=1 Tax=Ktedonobacter racemifer DSM 44963 TaxID=485913 RepID=D6TW53_KTERA|nr:conserved hypothetical protein [Ktedonobacter racemifer DSM 44963]
MTSKRKQYTSEFTFKVVMESFQRDTTIEAVSSSFSHPLEQDQSRQLELSGLRLLYSILRSL